MLSSTTVRLGQNLGTPAEINSLPQEFKDLSKVSRIKMNFNLLQLSFIPNVKAKAYVPYFLKLVMYRKVNIFLAQCLLLPTHVPQQMNISNHVLFLSVLVAQLVERPPG